MELLKAIASLPADYADFTALGKSIRAALADPAVRAEAANHPAVKLILDRISSEWRKVENDFTSIRKSNLFTFYGRVSDLLRAANVLERDVVDEQHDPAIGAAVITMPATLGALSKISSEWVKVEADIKVFR